MDCSNDPYGKPKAGCVAVAMAQIVRYWEYPVGQQYRYDEMPPGDNANLAIASLIGFCGDLVDMDYGCNESEASTSKVISSLKNQWGYSNNASFESYNILKVESDIKLGRPVLLRGCRTANQVLYWYTYDDCHAWVADGIRITKFNTGYKLKELHMNWGWGRWGGNGYTMGFEHSSSRNYQYDQYMGVNIYPN